MSIKVKSQAELDAIPLDTKEKIYIKFGTTANPAIIKNRYFYPVVAWNNSTVVAWGNSSVEASGNSTVVARGNSTVAAWDNSSVEAKGNVQVVDRLTSGAIWLSGNARKVCMPKTIEEYLNFYDIETDGKTAILYKAVHKQGNEYVSNYNRTFKYIIGELITEPECGTDVHENCGKGIHASHLRWALNFGKSWSDLAILALEVEIKDIIMPLNSNGKVRVPKAKVIREVPLSECGLYGKILERNII